MNTVPVPCWTPQTAVRRVGVRTPRRDDYETCNLFVDLPATGERLTAGIHISLATKAKAFRWLSHVPADLERQAAALHVIRLAQRIEGCE